MESQTVNLLSLTTAFNTPKENKMKLNDVINSTDRHVFHEIGDGWIPLVKEMAVKIKNVVVVDNKATPPPFGFKKINSPADVLSGSSNLVNSQVAVMNNGSLSILRQLFISLISNTRSCAHPSSPPCPI